MLDLEGFFVFNLNLATFDKLFCLSPSFGTFLLTAFLFSQTVKDGNSTDFSKTDSSKEGVFCLVAGLLKDLVHVPLVHILISYIAILLELINQQFASLINRQFLVLIFKELTNLVACLAGLNHVEPVTTRAKRVGVGYNFDLIPSFELGCQRNHTAIDLSTSCFFTDLRMDFIGKVDRT